MSTATAFGRLSLGISSVLQGEEECRVAISWSVSMGPRLVVAGSALNLAHDNKAQPTPSNNAALR
jgi:hypothetical protein